MAINLDATEIPGLSESQDTEKFHTSTEIENIYRCAKIERDWLSNPEMPSGYVITNFHATLFENVPAYLKKGMVPLQPGRYRIDDIRVTGEARNFYVSGLDVKPLMQSYTKELDERLSGLPTLPVSHTEEIMHEAAWAYYTFIRIHPYLDGNGRVGRMLLKRVLSGSGFRDIMYSQQLLKGKKFEENREQHLKAMNSVDKTGNLSYLEIYLAKLLLSRYSPKDGSIYQELEDFIDNKTKEVEVQKEKMKLTSIWQSFTGVNIEGGEESTEGEEYPRSENK
ncbi:MAG: Fic family protein [Microgenomates group bacterium]|jgi:Fic family protein